MKKKKVQEHFKGGTSIADLKYGSLPYSLFKHLWKDMDDEGYICRVHGLSLCLYCYDLEDEPYVCFCVV